MRILAAIGFFIALAVVPFLGPSQAQERARPPGIVGADNRVAINSREWP